MEIMVLNLGVVVWQRFKIHLWFQAGSGFEKCVLSEGGEEMVRGVEVGGGLGTGKIGFLK